MGMSLASNSCSCYDKSNKVIPVNDIVNKNNLNPNPNNYTIYKNHTIHGKLSFYTILDIRYNDCTNYEGRKILVYQNVTVFDLMQQGSIDPHFCDNPKFKSPIARFVPTAKGWYMAIKFIETMLDDEKPKDYLS